MFSKHSVGRKVFCNNLGEGTIVAYNAEDIKFPVIAEFVDTIFGDPNYAVIHFNKSGDKADIYGSIYKITLINTKQGSPEARRIVAMLAREYRKYSSKVARLGSVGEDTICLEAVECSLAKAYQQAKQLLGETNVRHI